MSHLSLAQSLSVRGIAVPRSLRAAEHALDLLYKMDQEDAGTIACVGGVEAIASKFHTELLESEFATLLA